ncbi:MAG: SMC-Scp complex subunit ScpB [Candidatus Micrarchaeaceae archaeon]
MTEANENYKNLVEAALFMSSKALSVEEIAKVIGLGSLGQVDACLRQLVEEYKNRNAALEIEQISGKYLLTVKQEYASKVSSLASGPEISKGALRLLAYISKNNGILQSDLVKAFGQSTYERIKELAEKEFVSSKKQGRSKKLFVTDKFREYFAYGEQPTGQG